MKSTFNSVFSIGKEDFKYVPLILGISLIIILILSKLEITIFILQDRVTYPTNFGQFILSNELVVLNIIILLFLIRLSINYKISKLPSLLCVLIFIALVSLNLFLMDETIAAIQVGIISSSVFYLEFKHIKRKKERTIDLKKIFKSFLLIVISFELFVISTNILLFIFSSLNETPVEKIVNFESEIQYLLGLLAPYILLLVIFSFLTKKIFQISTTFQNSKILQITESEKPILLYVAISVSILLTIFYNIPLVNPTDRDLSVDIPFYISWLNQIEQTPNISDKLNLVFTEINDGDRGLSLLIFHYLKNIFGELLTIEEFVRYIPVFLAPIFTMTSYYMTRTWGISKFNSSIVAMFSVFSFQYLIGVYAGFFSNWLALIFTMILFAHVIKYFQNGAWKDALFVGILSIVILYSYLYVWTYLISVLILFCILSIFIFKKQKKHILSVLVIILIIIGNFGLDYTKISYLDSRSASLKTLEIGSGQVELIEFQNRWFHLKDLFIVFLGGIFANFTMLILTLFWSIRATLKVNYERLMLSSFYVGIVVFLLSDFSIQSRVLYDMPIFVAAGLIFTKYEFFARNYKPILLFIILILSNYSIQVLSNLYYVIPASP